MTLEEMKIYDRIYAMYINSSMEKGYKPKALIITFEDYFNFTKIMKTAIQDLGLDVVLASQPYVLKIIS
jgi:hypothetical protein